jgi:hypothetical protein
MGLPNFAPESNRAFRAIYRVARTSIVSVPAFFNLVYKYIAINPNFPHFFYLAVRISQPFLLLNGRQ